MAGPFGAKVQGCLYRMPYKWGNLASTLLSLRDAGAALACSPSTRSPPSESLHAGGETSKAASSISPLSKASDASDLCVCFSEPSDDEGLSLAPVSCLYIV
jgi:hypothetical protein